MRVKDLSNDFHEVPDPWHIFLFSNKFGSSLPNFPSNEFQLPIGQIKDGAIG